MPHNPIRLQEYKDRLMAQSAGELVALFNRQVGVMVWTAERSTFLAALRYALEEHGVDLASVTPRPGETSYRNALVIEATETPAPTAFAPVDEAA